MKLFYAFCYGVARLINPPNRYRRHFRKTSDPSVRDFKSLKSDWTAVGRDFRKVMRDYGGR